VFITAFTSPAHRPYCYSDLAHNLTTPLSKAQVYIMFFFRLIATESTSESIGGSPGPTHRWVDVPSITESRQLDTFLSHTFSLSPDPHKTK